MVIVLHWFLFLYYVWTTMHSWGKIMDYFSSLRQIANIGDTAPSTQQFNPQLWGEEINSCLFLEHLCKIEQKRLCWNLNLARQLHILHQYPLHCQYPFCTNIHYTTNILTLRIQEAMGIHCNYQQKHFL